MRKSGRSDMRCRRGNRPIKVNPCDSETLCGITYTSSGSIKSSDPVINAELNEKLNLNSEKNFVAGEQKAGIAGID